MANVTPSLQRLYDVLELLVDERVGIVHCAGELPREAGAPDYFHFYAKACNTQAFSSQNNFRDSGGASVDRGLAMAKAIGEAVERYCAAIYNPDALPLSSYNSALFRCVPPEDFALFNANQYADAGFPYSRFDRDTRVRWAHALNLVSDETWYVPASMVFIPYACDRLAGEVSVVQPISTGLACHSTKAEAAASAICEVIERDAFTIVWQARLGMPHVELTTLNHENRDRVERFQRTGSDVTILNITLDHGVPTFLSILRGKPPEAPALVFAAAAHLDPGEAVRKSLEELAHTRRHAQYLKNTLPPITPGLCFENISKQDRHMLFYCQHENAHLADFILSSNKRSDFSSFQDFKCSNPQKDLQILVNKVSSVSDNVFLADLTTPDVEQVGLSVVRAIIPGFHPLFMGHRFRALGGKRLWEVPQQLGYKGISPMDGDNPVPHPYP